MIHIREEDFLKLLHRVSPHRDFKIKDGFLVYQLIGDGNWRKVIKIPDEGDSVYFQVLLTKFFKEVQALASQPSKSVVKKWEIVKKLVKEVEAKL